MMKNFLAPTIQHEGGCGPYKWSGDEGEQIPSKATVTK